MKDLADRVTMLEFKVENISVTFEKFLEQDMQAKKEILDEIKKFNTMVSWGKGGTAMAAAIGASLLWMWQSFRSHLWFH